MRRNRKTKKRKREGEEEEDENEEEDEEDEEEEEEQKDLLGREEAGEARWRNEKICESFIIITRWRWRCW